MAYYGKIIPPQAGGTGNSTFANTSALLTSGTTSTGSFQNIASVATGQVLTSAGTSTLPAWSAAPSVTSITLSSGTALSTYVEGTFTPTLTGSTTNPTVTYSAQVGNYTRIGNRVIVVSRVIITAISGGSGSIQISGLPFTSNSGTSNAATGSCVFANCTFDANVLYYQSRINPGTTIIILAGVKSNAGNSSMQVSDVTSTADINVSIIYQV